MWCVAVISEEPESLLREGRNHQSWGMAALSVLLGNGEDLGWINSETHWKLGKMCCLPSFFLSILIFSLPGADFGTWVCHVLITNMLSSGSYLEINMILQSCQMQTWMRSSWILLKLQVSVQGGFFKSLLWWTHSLKSRRTWVMPRWIKCQSTLKATFV